MTRACRTKRPCSVGGCKIRHQLLHELRESSVNEAIPAESNGQPGEVQEKAQAILNCAAGAKSCNVLFRILPVTLYGPTGQMNTYALLDEGASLTMIDTSILRTLGLQGHKREVNIKWFGGKSTQQSVTVADIEISGAGVPKRYKLNNVHGVTKINLPVQSLCLKDLNANDQLTKKLQFQSYCEAKPMLLIGLGDCH